MIPHALFEWFDFVISKFSLSLSLAEYTGYLNRYSCPLRVDELDRSGYLSFISWTEREKIY